MEGVVDGDRLSSLPENIIRHIFSFLDSNDIVRASTVSRKWRYIWVSMPYLCVDVPYQMIFNDFVDWVLMFRNRLVDVQGLRIPDLILKENHAFYRLYLHLAVDKPECFYPSFNNLKSLTLRFQSDDFNRHLLINMLDMLDCSPNLEALKIYFKSNGHVLQKMRISLIHNIGYTDKIISEVMNFPRLSLNVALTIVEPMFPAPKIHVSGETVTAPSVVRFGIDIPWPPGNLQTTRFITPPPPPPGSFYYQLNLIDISVGPHRLGFSQDLFRIREDGVPITRIAQHTNGVDVYVVMRVFEEYYDSKHLHRRGQRGAFRSCYDEQPGFGAFPTLTYHFQGANYVVDGENVKVFSECE
ncbi:hypothetical protein Ddye_027371 [Dipteronia dyeriana]|uniref:F-box domain-containing protein n=1 Tax=Dipteronia dyeriana TaxID=168575 RepID=A0AAD9TPL9_9ROSI|nr:hypothetical protein Ddye_027371 [Dipteronia dyeriana]